jgi:hypothetical protein
VLASIVAFPAPTTPSTLPRRTVRALKDATAFSDAIESFAEDPAAGSTVTLPLIDLTS